MRKKSAESRKHERRQYYYTDHVCSNSALDSQRMYRKTTPMSNENEVMLPTSDETERYRMKEKIQPFILTELCAVQYNEGHLRKQEIQQD